MTEKRRGSGWKEKKEPRRWSDVWVVLVRVSRWDGWQRSLWDYWEQWMDGKVNEVDACRNGIGDVAMWELDEPVEE